MIYLVDFSLSLLRRHVTRCAENHARCRMLLQHYHGRHFTEFCLTVRLLLSRLDQFRQAKIENFGITFARDHDVVGFEIPVHDAGGVGFSQTFGDLGQILQKL